MSMNGEMEKERNGLCVFLPSRFLLIIPLLFSGSSSFVQISFKDFSMLHHLWLYE